MLGIIPEQHTLTFICDVILKAPCRICTFLPFRCVNGTLDNTSMILLFKQWMSWSQTGYISSLVKQPMVHQLWLDAYKECALNCQMNVMAIFLEFGVVHINSTSLWRRPSIWVKIFWPHWQEWLDIIGASRISYRIWRVPALNSRWLSGYQRGRFWTGSQQTV